MPSFSQNRRRVLAGLAAGLFVPALARTAAAQEELRFRHAFGETVLPGPASRVVSLGYTTQDALLALGVVPLGIRDWYGDRPYGVWPWAEPLLKDAQPTLIKGNVTLERVAVLKPDLIVGIGSGISEAEYAALSRIAPVLMQSSDSPAYGMPWDRQTLLIGRAVGRQALAETLVAKTRQDLADIRARHAGWSGRTAIAAYHFGGETGLFASADTRGHFLKELGFEPAPAVESVDRSGTFYRNLSPEDLSPLDADLLLWVSSFDTAPDLAALPMRRALKAHREGREVFAGGLLAAAISFGSILSLPFAAARLEADIAAALDGDPATPVPSAVRAGLAP